MEERIQRWCCDITGETKYERGEDIMTVAHKIGDDHKRVSPECQRGVYGLQILKD